MDQDWDIAIILDACRYDYFKEFYQYFFEGELQKIVSKGSCTPEWFRKTFVSIYRDTIYVSANPFINSSSINLKGCCAKKHFSKVIDVWARSWDPLLGTVLPDKVNKTLLKIFDTSRGKRIIAHYLQPHAPYISPRYFVYGFRTPEIHKGQIFGILISETCDNKKSLFRKEKSFHKLEWLIGLVGKTAAKFGLGNGIALKLREMFRLPPASPLDATRRLYGVKGLQKAYITNLLIVLESLSLILEKLDGRIVITSDHGEFLGERNNFRHPCGINDPILRYIPYFTVKKIKKPKKPKFSLYPLKLKINLLARSRRRSI